MDPDDRIADINPCGIDKSAAAPRDPCKLGGLLTGILPCGTVCFPQLVPKGEGCKQVRGALSEVAARRLLSYAQYDNACALAAHCRNAARRQRTSLSSTLANFIFVCDAYHQPNHKACVDPENSHYVTPLRGYTQPECIVSQYPLLEDVPTTLNETFNAWLDRFCPEANHMAPWTLAVFALVLAELWNVHIVSTGRIEQMWLVSPSVSAPQSQLKRRRNERHEQRTTAAQHPPPPLHSSTAESAAD